ncbi:hypothetical protein [Candidatus Poriferisodalis sp.]|uniref:hypothetical protein n=1 Tax=Candidatus Poriferisodalis sp. TaxID=3101277 RepID=UPI003B01046C
MSEGTHVVDTVVLMYFLLVGQEGLLGDLLGRPLQVPVAVYDPADRARTHEPASRPELLSEMRQVVGHYEAAATLAEESESPDHALESFTSIKRVDELYDEGGLVPIEMTRPEQLLAARLQGGDVAEYGLKMGLGPGEAACVAIAVERGWTIATDDSDAFKVLDKLHGGPNYPYERIRKLLIRAADEGRISREEANRLHNEMRTLGFWDSGQPFPEAS